ncbi:MAG: FadR family transcriptional regulator [Deltaproteobacteria bacterium]|nr:FadR family transcriptional regulator [Deltaproteobacteria bacterium]
MFKTVKTDKISETIIQQIRKAIFEGLLEPGDKLPSERELVNTFGVSKATMREALRSLEVLGFLEIRQGVSGGAFVTAIGMAKARELFVNILHFKNLSLKHLTEVRFVLEAHTAAKAAEAIKPADLKRLKTLIEQARTDLARNDPSRLRFNELEFHRIIGSACGNPLLGFFVDLVHNLLADAKEILKPKFDFSLRVLEAHQRIYEALEDGNVEKARREMLQHLMEVEQDLVSLQKQKRIRGLGLSLDRGFKLKKEVVPGRDRQQKGRKRVRVKNLDN